MWTLIDGAWKCIKGTGDLIESAGKITGFYSQVESHMSFDDKIETLKRKCEDLRFQAEDVKTDLENAESSSREKRRKTVENWLTNVQNLRNQVDAALSQTGILERPQLANKVQNLTELAEEFLKQAKFRRGLTVNTPHDGGVDWPTKPLVGQAFQENFEKIWECLMKPEVVTIGIWGMGGVGKTTLVTHINNQAREHRDIFSNVFWVTVSQNLDIRKLQDELAKAASFSFNNEQDERKRAARLSSELKKKRYLFILDDLWHHIDLDRVGIPVQVNGCKLIITTRSLDVCERLICQQKIKVEPLSEEEAWHLFEKNLGLQAEALSPEVSKVARLVARECSGLPLGIITVAKCMKGVNDVCEWRCALKELRGSKDGRVEIKEEVFRVLKFSYNRLRDPKLQQSFLYCALYPEDHEIEREELVERLIDEGIIDGKESRQDQLDSGRTILNELVRSSLLEEAVNQEYVKMHDLLRDMAINMKSTEFMVKSGMQLEEVPGEQEWSEDVKRVSLMDNNIKEIVAVSPRCPKLSTLLLSDNGYLKIIENSFFQHMPTLQILALSNCQGIEELPDSISNLKNLTALVLGECSGLFKLPSLAELRSLKRLDLLGTRITEVPHGLERLVRLTYLDLRTQHLEVFPTGILPQLLLLEFLTVENNVEIKGEELQRLKRLSTFEGKLIFDDVNDFKSYVMSGGARRWPNYHFELNDTGKSVSWNQYLDTYKYEIEVEDEDEDTVNFIHGVKVKGLNMSKRAAQEEGFVDAGTMEVLRKDIQSLELEKCYGARNLCDVSWLDNATQYLKWFKISNCGSLECLVSSSTPTPAVEGAFSCLKVLYLIGCHKIKILFHPSFLPNLRNLERITVIRGAALEEIVAETISEGEASTSTIEYALPNLTGLWLLGLPQLKSICPHTISCPSLCRITVAGCQRLKRIPISSLPSSLRSITVSPKEWWESVEWDHPNAKELLKPYLN